MSFSRYPTYKDSGVEWLGQVPGHWSVEPFKHQIERNDGGVWGDDPDGINDTFVLRSTEQTADGNWKIDDPAPRKLSESDINGSLLAENDLLLTKSSGSSLHIGKTTLVTAEIAAMRCCYSNFMQRIRMKPTFLPKLAWHVMNNDLARLQFDLLSNSSTGLANLNATMVGQIFVPVPPLPEQAQIAAFLDRETVKIDALVAEQRRLMALLKEKRQAVISHAVTRGLNPDAPMKPSGIEWLGDVPEHWNVKKVKHISSRISSGKTPSGGSEIYVDEGITFLRSQNVYDEGLRLDDVAFITEAVDTAMAGSRVAAHDILLNITGASIGRSCVVPIALPSANVNQHVCVIRLKNISTVPLIGWTFKSTSIKNQIDHAQNGAAREGLNFVQIGEMVLALPPTIEQAFISLFLDTESAKFDTLTAEAQRAIDLLLERRTALISAAVTGQIDVRKIT